MLCGLAPAQIQMDLFFDTLCARNKQRAANFNQSEEAMTRVTASARDIITDFRGNGYSKKRLLWEPTHAITTLLSNSPLLGIVINLFPFHFLTVYMGGILEQHHEPI